jgi:UDP-N-acetyl-D-glucosamine 2-epimerase, UDP-hydrolysing
MSERKLCVVTGTRAEYGILVPLLEKIQKSPEFSLQLVVTGTHLSPEFGLTCRMIEEDGYVPDRKVEMLLSSDTKTGVAKSVGLGVIGFADAFCELSPDLLILTGDRYEMLAAAQTALFARIPAAHIAGGDTTEGAFDEAIRHSITKMSHIHFVTNQQSWQRVRQLGENPVHIHNVGSLGIDRIKTLMPISRSELEKRLQFSLKARNLLISFHPVTLEENTSGRQFGELLEALHDLGPETGLIFTKPNADPGGREIILMLDDFVSRHPNSAAYASLGDLVYLSLLPHVDAVVGNSSSGLYEVPSFQKPTVNIGDRQKGRLMAPSVLCCTPEKEEIGKALIRAFEMDCSETVNPYGKGDSADCIVQILKGISDYKLLLKKQFYGMDQAAVRKGMKCCL